jgi:hypothetical protein
MFRLSGGRTMYVSPFTERERERERERGSNKTIPFKKFLRNDIFNMSSQ